MEKMKEEICSQCRHCISCFCGDEFDDCKLKNMPEEPPTEYVELRNQVRFYRKMAQQLEKENKRLKSHIEWLEKRPNAEDAAKTAGAIVSLVGGLTIISEILKKGR